MADLRKISRAELRRFLPSEDLVRYWEQLRDAAAGAQASSDNLVAIAALTLSANKLIYATGAGAVALTDFSTLARNLLSDSTEAAMRIRLGLVIGTHVQAFDATLTAFAGLPIANMKVPYGTGVDAFGLLDLDTDGALAANSDTRLATQKAVKSYVDGIVAAQDAMVFKGLIDCSTNPNYPAADRGHTYRVSVAGKIGGAAGPNVEAGDILMCLTDGTIAGTHAAVGAQWGIIQTNIDGALISGGALGTPSSGTLTNCTGLPVASGISGLGASVATFLATPSSTNLRAALTDETGSGSAVFGTHPTINDPEITGTRYFQQGAPASYAAAATLLAADLLGGLVQYTGAVANLTLPTAANLDAGVVAGLANDRAFDFSVINTGSATATVVTNTGWTLVGAMTVAAGTPGAFRARKTGSGAYTAYRLA
ncbi:MAG TPA: hypothetical protein VF522_19120 [Ramlibacter sp.]|uniref:hypothetical protein n=1 Tax=Ramlibacter sp. TaxID=1917967 RepID=UPI002ED4EEBA